MDSRLNDAIRDYQNARAHHAYVLRMEGLVYPEIGQRLGVGPWQARTLAQKGERKALSAQRIARIIRPAN